MLTQTLPEERAVRKDVWESSSVWIHHSLKDWRSVMLGVMY